VRRRDGQQALGAPQPDEPLPLPHPLRRRAARRHQAAAAAEAQLQPAAEDQPAHGADQVRGRVVKVSQLPPGRLLRVAPEDSLAQVAREMRRHDSDSVAVMTDESLVGIITERDLVRVDDWHPVARVADLASGGPLGARLLGEDIVVWRSGDVFHAWRDLCVHRGTRLSLGRVVDGQRLECAYHGWTYAGDGRCVLMPAHPEQTPPAKACVSVYRARAEYGVVWVTLGTGRHDLPRFELLDDPAHNVLTSGPYRVHASGPRVVENFLDVGHFPFVHEGILGDRARPEIADYDAEVNEDGVQIGRAHV